MPLEALGLSANPLPENVNIGSKFVRVIEDCPIAIGDNSVEGTHVGQ